MCSLSASNDPREEGPTSRVTGASRGPAALRPCTPWEALLHGTSFVCTLKTTRALVYEMPAPQPRTLSLGSAGSAVGDFMRRVMLVH